MKERVIYVASALVFVLILFFFASSAPKKDVVHDDHEHEEAMIDPQMVIDSLKKNLPPAQAVYLQELENNITRGDLKTQSAQQYTALADFWKDSVGAFVPYAYYLSKSAMLDNSEKSLTFAAQFIFENMRRESHPELKLWEAQTAAGLYEQALKLDSSNADLKIGLGSCYVYGPGMTGNPQQTMKGIQHLLEVVRKDSNNMKAQMVLGIASVISNQSDKGIQRLEKVVGFDPHNLEAVSWLADAYAAEGDVANAKKWYEQSKHIVNNPAFSKEIDERIKILEQKQ